MSARTSPARGIAQAVLGLKPPRGRPATRRRIRTQYPLWRRCLAAVLQITLPAIPQVEDGERAAAYARRRLARRRRRNLVRVCVVLAALSATLCGIGALFGEIGAFVALAAALAINSYGYASRGAWALRAMRAQELSEAQAPALFRLTRDLSEIAGTAMPRIYVSPTDSPNMLMVGTGRGRPALCATTGLLRILSERELRAVIAHEVALQRDWSTTVSTLVGAWATTVAFAFGLGLLADAQDPGEPHHRPGALALLLLSILGSIAAWMILLATDSSREGRADAEAARLSGDPLALASALHKLDYVSARLPLLKEPRLLVADHLMIVRPFGDRHASVLLHQPVTQRIARLEAMA